MTRKTIMAVSVLAVLLSAGFTVSAQDFDYDWCIIPVTSEYDEPAETPVSAIVSKARKGMEYLNEVVAVSAKEMTAVRPESDLSNLTADIIAEMAGRITGSTVDCALYNMGGIRITLPEGDIKLSDIVSCYPFKNTLVIARMSGESLLRFFADFAAMRQPEAVSGINITVSQDGKLQSVLVQGKEIDPDESYNMASISFLVSGGDGFFLENYADEIIDTGVQVKDAVLDYCRQAYKDGRILDADVEGRYVIEDK